MNFFKKYLYYLKDIFSSSVGEKVYHYKQYHLWFYFIFTIIIISALISTQYTYSFSSLIKSINQNNFNSFSISFKINPKRNIVFSGISFIKSFNQTNTEKINASNHCFNTNNTKICITKINNSNQINKSLNKSNKTDINKKKNNNPLLKNNIIKNYASRGFLIYNNSLYYSSVFCFLDKWICHFTTYKKINLGNFIDLPSFINNKFDKSSNRINDNNSSSLKIKNKSPFNYGSDNSFNKYNNSNKSKNQPKKQHYFNRNYHLKSSVNINSVLTDSFIIGVFVVLFILCFIFIFIYAFVSILIAFLLCALLTIARKKMIFVKTLFKVNVFSSFILLISFVLSWFFLFHSLIIPFIIYLIYCFILISIESTNYELIKKSGYDNKYNRSVKKKNKVKGEGTRIFTKNEFNKRK